MAEAIVTQEYTTREQRALRLFRERGGEIVEYGPNMWSVPSCTGKKTYTVEYGAEHESCECPDFQFRGENCKHLLATAIKSAKSKARPTRASHGCINGVVYLTYEEDGHEWLEPKVCAVCSG